jgi:hypothetical protein
MSGSTTGAGAAGVGDAAVLSVVAAGWSAVVHPPIVNAAAMAVVASKLRIDIPL